MDCPNQSSCCWGHVCPNGSKVRTPDRARIPTDLSDHRIGSAARSQCFHYTKGKCWFKGGEIKPGFGCATCLMWYSSFICSQYAPGGELDDQYLLKLARHDCAAHYPSIYLTCALNLRSVDLYRSSSCFYPSSVIPLFGSGRSNIVERGECHL